VPEEVGARQVVLVLHHGHRDGEQVILSVQSVKSDDARLQVGLEVTVVNIQQGPEVGGSMLDSNDGETKVLAKYGDRDGCPACKR
jgi:hypothetical protein